MGWIEGIKEQVTKRIADTLLMLVSLSLVAIGAFADDLMPGVIELLGGYATGKTVLGLLLVVLGLASWIFYLHPRIRYDHHTGTFYDRKNNIRYCPKCRAKDKIDATVIEDSDNSGWRCTACNWFWSNPDYKAPDEPPRKGPKGPHAWMAR